MSKAMVIHGREIGVSEIALIRGLMERNAEWGRTRLSEELCRLWSWRAANGRPKDMACRTLLRKLERAGKIELPAPRRPANNEIRNRSVRLVEHQAEPIECKLHELLPLEIRVVEPRDGEADLFNCLVLPWVRVPNLASHVLSLICRRLRDDWTARYGHPISAVETFVDRSRFLGTCYQAANWRKLGQTSGRTRNGKRHESLRTIKDVYRYALTPRFRHELCPQRGGQRVGRGEATP